MSPFFLAQGARLTIVEGRSENIAVLKQQCSPWGDIKIVEMDLNHPTVISGAPFEIVFCYGLLYHLENPTAFLDWTSSICGEVLLLETCVTSGLGPGAHPISEHSENPSQALSGGGCRPDRQYLFHELKRRFSSVYLPRTQPDHDEFPLHWEKGPLGQDKLSRAIFVASKHELKNELLVPNLLSVHEVHEPDGRAGLICS